MKSKLLKILILLLSLYSAKGQIIMPPTIEIGQSAEAVAGIIEWSTKDMQRPLQSGYRTEFYSYDIKYFNGQITEVIQCINNHLRSDLRMNVNLCKYFIMQNGKLSYILTQYYNVSVEKLINSMDNYYNELKINDLYFDSDFEHYEKIYLAKNGYATIEWRKAGDNQQALKINEEYKQKQIIEKKRQEEVRRTEVEQKHLAFLQERTTAVYDYQNLAKSNYDNKDRDIKTELADMLLAEEEVVDDDIAIKYLVDTLEVKKVSVTKTDNRAVNSELRRIADEIDLRPLTVNNYTVNTKANFRYSLYSEKPVTIRMKKDDKQLITFKNPRLNDEYKTKANQIVENYPIGHYTLRVKRVFVDTSAYYTGEMLKYKGAGGPEYAFLSVLVPGWGDRYVTVGAKSGVSTALWFYGMVGAGIGFKALSNNEYRKYEQSLIDTHHDDAKTYNTFFYTCIGVGAVIWIQDIIYVATQGAQNKKIQRAFERSRLSFQYDPQFDAKGLSYFLNF
jgi:hypothetical protein